MAAPVIPLDGAWGARLRPQSFRMRQGDSRDLTVTLRDRAGDVADVTGTYVWRMSGDDTPGGGVKLTKSGAVTNGVMTVNLTSSDTETTPERYYHDAEVTETSGGAVSTVMSGHIEIRDDMGGT